MGLPKIVLYIKKVQFSLSGHTMKTKLRGGGVCSATIFFTFSSSFRCCPKNYSCGEPPGSLYLCRKRAVRQKQPKVRESRRCCTRDLPASGTSEREAAAHIGERRYRGQDHSRHPLLLQDEPGSDTQLSVRYCWRE